MPLDQTIAKSEGEPKEQGIESERIKALEREVRELRQATFITDFELIAQTLWASVHGVCSLEIALGHETWIHWVDIDARLRLMQSVILRGVLQHPESLN